MKRTHKIDAEAVSAVSAYLDMVKIRGAVARALDLMGGVLDVRELQANDRSHDWEFRPVDQLHEKHGMLGFYWREGVLVNIYWDADLPLNEVELTIAHELGHHFLHSLESKPVANSQSETDLMELEAEVFSRELLGWKYL